MKITEFIAQETGGKSFKTSKYAHEGLPQSAVDYEETAYKDIPTHICETENYSSPVDLTSKAESLSGRKPLFSYFLDGSRHTYRVDDIVYGQKIFPVIAGQIGVGVCNRENKKMKKSKLEMHNVVVLPESADKDGHHIEQFFENLKNNICGLSELKKRNIKFSKALYYSETLKQETDTYEKKGIAKVQDEMIEKEKAIVAELVKTNALDGEHYLLKDGSLEYKVMACGDYKELIKIKNNYRYCIGASKTFDPEKFKNHKGKSNASAIANLPKFHRTQAYLYEPEITGGVPFAVWYVRIRESKYSHSPFDGVLKLEKILTEDKEKSNGLDSSLINHISANIINERNPVCYGNDERWANHLYPVYLTETFIKSNYLSSVYFLNLF